MPTNNNEAIQGKKAAEKSIKNKKQTNEINKFNQDINWLFACAVWHDHKEYVQDIVENKETNKLNLDVAVAHGNRALHYAVHRGHLDMVVCLLNNKANVTRQNGKGDTALHIACKRGYCHIVDVLLDNMDDEAKQKLLNQKNVAGDTPLSLAAGLADESIYDKLIKLKGVAYEKEVIEKAYQQRIAKSKRSRWGHLWAALIESFCPSASVAELTESFAYSGLLASASAAVAVGVDIVFAIGAMTGLSLITLANYKKKRAESHGKIDYERSRSDAAILTSLKYRYQFLQAKVAGSGLTDGDKEELSGLNTTYQEVSKRNKLRKQGYPLKGSAKSGADYVTKTDKAYTILSSAGSFLCAYSGILGVMGLGLGIASGIMGLTVGSLAIATSPIGICLGLGVGLVLAAGLGAYHYKKRKQAYASFGAVRMKIAQQTGKLESTLKQCAELSQDIQNVNKKESGQVTEGKSMMRMDNKKQQHNQIDVRKTKGMCRSNSTPTLPLISGSSVFTKTIVNPDALERVSDCPIMDPMIAFEGAVHTEIAPKIT